MRRLLVDLSKLDEFKDFDAALAGLAFGEEGMRPAHECGDFALGQASFFAGRGQFFKKSVVQSLMGRGPSLAGNTRLGLFPFLHPSSVVNA